MRKVIVVDWLDTYGGAERVIKSLYSIFSFDKCYTLINIMSKNNQNKIFSKHPAIIKETTLKHCGSKFRWFFILFHFLIDKIKIDQSADIIISSSHSVAKGVKKSRKNQLHISYFQARNFKYIWADYKLYFGKFSFLVLPIIKLLRRADIHQSRNPDYIISNSNYVKEWVKDTYNRDSEVIYPGVDLSKFNLKTEKKEFYVTVGRLEPYKRFDLIVDAFNETGKKLIIIGDGSQLKQLNKRAKHNIEFRGFLESEEVFNYISEAKGFVHAGIEDFGIAPIEAQACGTPVIGYNKGGLKETVIHNKTGILFEQQSYDSIIEALVEFEKVRFNYKEVREHALKFSSERFEEEFKTKVEKLYINWKEQS